MLNDVHHHLLTPQYIAELSNIGFGGGGGLPFPNWVPEDSLKIMDRYGTRSSILSLSSPGLSLGDPTKICVMARAINEFAAETVAHWPQRFGFFATLPLPDVESALTEIIYALDHLNADGIVLLSNYAGIYLGDPRFEPIFAELDRRSAVVYIHPTVFTGSEISSANNAGSPIPTIPSFMLEFVFDTTRAVTNLVIPDTLKRYPHMRIIVSHSGGTIPFVANKIMKISSLMSLYQPDRQALEPEAIANIMQNMHEEILSQLRTLYYDTALSANINALGSLQQLVPSSHILWGSDFPFAPEYETISSVHFINSYTGWDDHERQQIQSANALTLFPRLQK